MRLASPCIVYCIFKSYLTPTRLKIIVTSLFTIVICVDTYFPTKKSKENENDDIPIKKPL